MEKAVGAYERGRFQDAFRLSTELVRELPVIAPVRRLAGFSAYRLGRWRDAVRHLSAYTELTDEPDAFPALMDAQRALGRHAKVAATWTELRRRSPDPDLLAEARIVAAGSLGDRGELLPAIELLASAGAARSLRNPSDRHVRQWYALGDLYERASDLPKARELFERVARVDAEAYDVTERLEALGPVRAGSRRPRGRQRPAPRKNDQAARKSRGSAHPGAIAAESSTTPTISEPPTTSDSSGNRSRQAGSRDARQ